MYFLLYDKMWEGLSYLSFFFLVPLDHIGNSAQEMQSLFK